MNAATNPNVPSERVPSPSRRKTLTTKLLALVSLLAFALCCAAPLAAQTAGEGAIEGSVLDATGAIVPNATVTATNVNTGIVTTRPATSAGFYNIGPLLPGTYTLTVEASGFSTFKQENLIVDAAHTSGLNVTLKAGSASPRQSPSRMLHLRWKPRMQRSVEPSRTASTPHCPFSLPEASSGTSRSSQICCLARRSTPAAAPRSSVALANASANSMSTVFPSPRRANRVTIARYSTSFHSKPSIRSRSLPAATLPSTRAQAWKTTT